MADNAASMKQYHEYAAGYRQALPGIASNNGEGFCHWITLTADITIPRMSGGFIGLASGKHALVNAANTGGTILGWLDAQKFEHSELGRAKDPHMFALKTGDQLALWNNPGMEYRIKVNGTDKADAIKKAAALVVGQTYGLKVDSAGNQVLDSTDTTNKHVTVVSTLPGLDMVRVQIARPLNVTQAAAG